MEPITEYIKQSIDNFAVRADLALDRMYKYRCPLSCADRSLYDRISECIEDWCNDYDQEPEEYDPEQIFDEIDF